jgi:3-methyladenine DNA glycosylase AlkD
VRRLVKPTDRLGLADLRTLLHSRWHEERLLALLILVRRFERGDEQAQGRLYRLYLRSTAFINNWDLVDCSAPPIVGAWLLERPRSILDTLAHSSNLWQRRIAVLATFAFIRRGQFEDTLRLCQQLRNDPHDLLHKACGWMLREVGKRDRRALESFLRRHAAVLPRTMLRYALERLPEPARREWLRHRAGHAPKPANGSN